MMTLQIDKELGDGSNLAQYNFMNSDVDHFSDSFWLLDSGSLKNVMCQVAYNESSSGGAVIQTIPLEASIFQEVISEWQTHIFEDTTENPSSEYKIKFELAGKNDHYKYTIMTKNEKGELQRDIQLGEKYPWN